METILDKKRDPLKRSRGSHYSVAFKKEIVRSIEDGLSRREVREMYDIRSTTLMDWITLYRTDVSAHAQRRRFKPSEKRSILRAYESGMSISEINVAFGLKHGTVYGWIKKIETEKCDISSHDFPIDMAKKTKPEDDDIIKLKKALEESQLKVKALETMIDVAEEQLKIDIRKKSGAKRS